MRTSKKKKIERRSEGRRERGGEREEEGSGLNPGLLEGPKLSTVRVRMRAPLCPSHQRKEWVLTLPPTSTHPGIRQMESGLQLMVEELK